MASANTRSAPIAREVIEAATLLIDVVELAGNRAAATDGPVGNELHIIADDPYLAREYGTAYRALRAALERKAPTKGATR